MITSRIQIADGPVLDTYRAYGFIYRVGDRRFSPPEKKRDKTTYAEEPGSHEDPRTVDDEFDHTVEFILEAPNRNFTNANSRIRAFNEAIRTRTPGSHIKQCRTVTLYDDYKRCRITGIPEIIEEVTADNYHRHQLGGVPDCVVISLKIHVSDPTLCDFDLPVPFLRIGNTVRTVSHVYTTPDTSDKALIFVLAAAPFDFDENGDILNLSDLIGFSYSNLEIAGIIIPDSASDDDVVYFSDSPRWLATTPERYWLKFTDETTGLPVELDTAGAIVMQIAEDSAATATLSLTSLMTTRPLTLRAKSLMEKNT